MEANEPKVKALGRFHKGGYVARNPVSQAVQRNNRDRKEAEDIVSEIEEGSGLLRLLDVLESRDGD